MNRVKLVIVIAVLQLSGFAISAEDPSFTRTEDVIYGRKFGTALTMDVFRPKEANGAAVIWVVSGGFRSSHDAIRPALATPLLAHGYTVFAVVHGSQPRFQIPEIIQDMRRSVRFIRYHAKDYGIDANRIGVTGASAGGHLSLMLATTGDKGDASAGDPVQRESSRVQTVACFFPATDFLNFGGPGKEFIHATDHQPPFRAAFDYHGLDRSKMLWDRITDEEKLRKTAREISPISFISADTPPTLIIHGDKDPLVPFQQSETFVEKLKAAGGDAKLITKKGAGHGWADMLKDIPIFVDWFDQHLKKSTVSGEAEP